MAATLEDTLAAPVHPSYLHSYHPYYSNKFDRASGRILDFKEGQAWAIDYYLDAADREVPEDAVICRVPPHAPGKNGPVLTLARRLAGRRQRADASRCLVRHTEIQKLSNGGRRDPEVHLESVRVENVNRIRGRDVVLVDDVTTTGNSFLACKTLLLDAGAQSVDCFALAKTQH
jgi:predicted amidophosphoribosyltransferase